VWIFRGSKMINQLEARLESHWMIYMIMGVLTTLLMNMDFPKQDFLGLAMWQNALTNLAID